MVTEEDETKTSSSFFFFIEKLFFFQRKICYDTFALIHPKDVFKGDFITLKGRP